MKVKSRDVNQYFAGRFDPLHDTEEDDEPREYEAEQQLPSDDPQVSENGQSVRFQRQHILPESTHFFVSITVPSWDYDESNEFRRSKKKRRRKEWLLPVLLGCGLEGNVDAIDVIEDLIADPRPVVVERFIVDVVVSAGFIGLDASAETVFIGTPPLLATAPRQLGRHGSGRVKYRVGFQVTNYASVTTLIGVRAKIAHIFGAGLPMITL